MMQEWFPDAKLGIFIHWGIYAVRGIDESWSFFNGKISYPDYMGQLDGFTASKYDPAAWADLFVRAGAKYAVLTTKHHDGVALWDTQANDLSVVKRTPAARDLLTPWVNAVRDAGLKVGFYYSHLDWSHPDYASVLPDRDDPEQPNPERYKNRYAYPEPDKQDPAAWARFIHFHRQQLEELSTQFGEVDLYWFDGEWERTPEQFDMAGLRRQLEAWQPQAIFNSRLLDHGDYATPEQGIPISPPDGEWEFCVTINDHWGYQGEETKHKSLRQVVRMFAETIGMGGNMLLDIGPREDGTIVQEQVDVLQGLGDWIRRFEPAVYGSRVGLPAGMFYGASTRSKDGKSLFLIFFDPPRDQIAVKGLLSSVTKATLMDTGEELTHTKIGGLGETPGIVWIDVPTSGLDASASVVRLDFDEPFRVYEGAGRR